VSPDSPAALIGLEPSDVILVGNGVNVESPKDLSRLVADLELDSSLALSIWHRGEQRDVEVQVGQLTPRGVATQPKATEPPDVQPEIGLSLAPLSPESRAKFGISDTATGSVVVAVQPHSPAALQQIRPGDVIVRVGHVAVTSPADVVAQVGQAARDQRDVVLLLVERSGQAHFVAVPLA
jgi:serine protease Do